MGLKYSVHAYAWTNSFSNKTLDIIKRAKILGFDYIEIPLMEIELIDSLKIRQKLQKVGISVLTSAACQDKYDVTSDSEEIRQCGIEYLKQCVKATAEMGGTCFTGPLYAAIGKHAVPEKVHWKRAVKALREVAQFASQYGVTVGIEPINRYETFLINTCEQAMRLRKMIDEKNIAIHPDTYHMNIEEENFYEPLKAVGKHICHIHASESHRGTPGQGTVNWDEVFKALAEVKYQGTVGMESFIGVSEVMRAATCIWRQLAPSSDALLSNGLKFLKSLEQKYYVQQQN